MSHFRLSISKRLIQTLSFLGGGTFFLCISSCSSYELTAEDRATKSKIEFARTLAPTPKDAPPVLVFSDLTHAPKNGWSHEKSYRGAAVSIWGRGFGDKRDNSFVTVNGVELKKDSDYCEWNAESNDVFFLRRITFWINDDCKAGPGKIFVTVNKKKSKAIPFTTIPGNLYFVHRDSDVPGNGSLNSPWSDIRTAVTTLQPGDILYVREGDTAYDQKYLSGRQNLYLSGDNAENGRKDSPIAIASYPGETATFDAIQRGERGTLDSNIYLAKDYWTVSKLRLRALTECLHLGRFDGSSGVGIRAVGNDCVGCQISASGTAAITTFASQIKVLGNSSHGGVTAHKRDHAIYVSGNPSRTKGVELGWNYVYDNDYAEGPMVVVNHQGDRIPEDQSCKEHRIHHNVIDCVEHPSRGIGIYSMSWDGMPGETPPDRALVFNNFLIGAGSDKGSSNGAMYCTNGKASFLNNTLINTHQYGFVSGGTGILSVLVEGNIFHMKDGRGYLYLHPPSAQVRVNNNQYYGLSNMHANDSNAEFASPKLNRHLVPSGRVVPHVANNNSGVVTSDFWGYQRSPDLPLAIGACERPSF